MKRFVQGSPRDEPTLPQRLEDFISQDNPVRLIDQFINGLDLEVLGFKGVIPCATGRPSYHPAVMLKLYAYGYFYQIQSSRRLEQETHRNIEMMWLLNSLKPDFKTIADFRKNNGQAIRRVCHQFTLLCQQWKLLSTDTAVIDGSKFKAVNNRDKNLTPAKVRYREKRLESAIRGYMRKLDAFDKGLITSSKKDVSWLKERIEFLQEELKQLTILADKMKQTPDKQLSLTDPDARSMHLRDGGIVGYNVQIAVEPMNHFIVYSDVINQGNDRAQLAAMALPAKAVLKAEKLKAIADKGYFKGEEIVLCEQLNIDAYVPKSHTSGNEAAGLFPREYFIYQPDLEEWLCPAGEHLTWRFRSIEKGKVLDTFWSSACPSCAMKAQCTTSQYRRIKRWCHESVLDEAQQRLSQEPERMKLRRVTVEHPFGTMKSWMGYTHFLTKRLPNVKTEISLMVLAYNLKRAMKVLGCEQLLQLLIFMVLSIAKSTLNRLAPW